MSGVIKSKKAIGTENYVRGKLQLIYEIECPFEGCRSSASFDFAAIEKINAKLKELNWQRFAGKWYCPICLKKVRITCPS